MNINIVVRLILVPVFLFVGSCPVLLAADSAFLLLDAAVLYEVSPAFLARLAAAGLDVSADGIEDRDGTRRRAAAW